MQRENYYIILELSIDPPENDPEIIEKAIQKKKVEWSRLRNHPTKGLQIQKFINMIPDIQYVMQDETLRKKEAHDAAELIEAGKENKISKVDDHIDILMGKGYIAKEDIIRLAEIHGLSQNEINARIEAKKDSKYAKIDLLISLRMAKGYITEDEIAKISKKNAISPEELRKRIRCPIAKDDKEIESIKIQPIDKSVEKTINDHLKVVGKTSLYDFLGAPETSILKQLQEKSGKKKKGLGTIGRKDAVVTAGVALAGHCLTIFKSDETRIAYDVTLAKAKFSTLDSDINIAALNNKIRYEYFDALIKKAMKFGMDRDEAINYIKAHSRKKKFRIEKKPANKRSLLIAATASVLATIVAIAGFLVFSKIHHKNLLKTEYEQLIQEVDAQSEPNRKIRLLKKYITTHAEGEYSADAKGRISKIEFQINAENFRQVLQQADLLIEAKKLEEALALYNEHLAKGLDKENQKKVNSRINDVLALIEKRDFDEVSIVSLNGEAYQKIEVFQTYLENHPNGKNKANVQSLIDEMSGEYFIYVKKMLALHENSEHWEDCVRLCQSYIDIYDNSNSDQLKKQLPVYHENVRNEKIYASLTEKATLLGTNYEAASQIFKDYLEAYPKSSITKKIQNEINRLDDLITIQNINRATNAMRLKFAATNGRFIEKHPGVIIDSETGLMWCMLDSDTTESDICLTYEQGKNYVKSLNTGGFEDWRLPTPEELAGIFKTSPAFPVNTEKSYWTSESYTGYSDGWQIQVATLTSEDSTQWEVVRKNALDCGTVRAVRTP